MRRYMASLTVEASYVMPMVIFALAVLVRTAYGECIETTDAAAAERLSVMSA